MANECVVYHKHLAGMDLTDGYIGISKNFKERMKQHHRDAFVKNSIYTVHERMRMYGDEVITSKIFEGSINECFDYEEELRPRWHMGWNMAIGGGRPGSGWKPGKTWLCNRVWHSEYGEEQVSKNNTCTDIGNRYGISGNGISNILRGQSAVHKGWELANSQLVMRVENKLLNSGKWEAEYVMKNEQIIKVVKKKAKAFYIDNDIKPHYNFINMLRTGRCETFKGWELATEKEWLETAERVEFK